MDLGFGFMNWKSNVLGEVVYFNLFIIIHGRNLKEEKYNVFFGSTNWSCNAVDNYRSHIRDPKCSLRRMDGVLLVIFWVNTLIMFSFLYSPSEK